ncbi:HAD family hydrolase [Oscillatoria sp. FACHB-1407]|uniref:HAD family hydrolase n=1 Tax=Oscillatoria sp. FACHB-1407 TaxID=2692847 RepID=UPI001687A128|nr:HAD family hydrolase [Oscillatoria sp. FACHB-1407]MBD2464655.1 HAD family hydrolase [Oscillatoria sp. FACHB-1407]
MTQLQALIFDVDGTLADTERDGHRIAFNRAFADAGLAWEWSVELYGELLEVTGGKERIKFYIDRYNPEFEPPANLKEWIAGLHAAKTKHYTQLLSEGTIPMRPGVKRLLLEARQQGVRLAIATTTTPANVTALLENALAPDSVGWFDIIGAGDIVPAKKPAPDIYDYVLKELNLDPKACLAFEDSQQGVKSSRAANLATIVTVNGYTQDHDFTGAELVIDQFGEPDQSFQVISGNAYSASYFDLELAEQVLKEVNASL